MSFTSLVTGMGTQASIADNTARLAPLTPVPTSRGFTNMFNLELQQLDDDRTLLSATERDEQLMAELRRHLSPSSEGIVKDIDKVIMEQLASQQAVQVSTLAQALAKLGYRVCLRHAVGGGGGTLSLRNLRHTFLSVSCPGSTGSTFIVDPNFADQFQIAKPTRRYSALLAAVPNILIIPEDRIAPLVSFLCSELACSFQENGMVLPPWRQAKSMMSKWQPRRSLDEPIPGSSSAPDMQRESFLLGSGFQELLGARKVHPTDMGPNGRKQEQHNESSIAIISAQPLLPKAVEPARVYGGFNSYMSMLS